MPMEKRTAAAVLADQTAVVPVLDQRCIGHGLGETPVHVDLAASHAAAFVDDALDTSVQLHVRRNLREVVSRVWPPVSG